MSSLDIDKLYKKWVELDKELKELKKEVSEIKWKQQYGHSGAVAYSATSFEAKPNYNWQLGTLMSTSETEQWDDTFK